MDSLFRTAQIHQQPTNITSNPVVLADDAVIDVTDARLIEPYRIAITFSDGFVQTVNFGPFLQNSLNPHIRKYLDLSLFADFTVENGDLYWHGYDLCFPIADLYENRI